MVAGPEPRRSDDFGIGEALFASAGRFPIDNSRGHVQAEFSFSTLGFEKATEVDEQDVDVANLLSFGVEVDG